MGPVLRKTKELWNRLLGRKPNTLPPFDFKRNPYKARTRWPPKILEMSEFRQFHFERRWKRRTLEKAINPRWQKGVKIVTWVSCSLTAIYGIWFYDFRYDAVNPQPGEQPFQELRDWTWDFLRGIFGDFWSNTAKSLEEVQQTRGRPALEGGKSEVQPEGDRGMTKR